MKASLRCRTVRTAGRWTPWLVPVALISSALVESLPAGHALQPAGAVPVLKEVDVVVVGGSSGGVAAALEAARAGARVFVAAPRPYLGEDICATYRYWLEPGEELSTALARETLQPLPPLPVEPAGPRLAFTYAADIPSASLHRDTASSSLLRDGKWQSASSQSVQYDGDVTLDLDLGSVRNVGRIVLQAYQRPADFEVGQVVISAGQDRQEWKPIAALKNEQTGAAAEDKAIALRAEVSAQARYLKLLVKRAPDARRLLLGEVIVEGPVPADAPPPPRGAPRPATPLQVKRALDQALIKAGVPFIYSSFATDLLRDDAGRPAGVVIANRSGRQAVLARAIVDATDHAVVARLAGAQFSPYPPETQVFRRAVVGGSPRRTDSLSLLVPPAPVVIADRKGEVYPLHLYEIHAPMRGGGPDAFAEIEQLARDWTWTPNAVDASEVLFQVPPDKFRSRKPFEGPWPGPQALPLECLQPENVDRLHVLGGHADVPREAASRLLRPVTLMAVGERLGKAAAQEALSQPALRGVKVAAARPASGAVPGEVREAQVRDNNRAGKQVVPAEAQGLPVLGEYDVVVVGGGTGGAPAGIGAGRQGARTLLLEYLHGLGGVGTVGYISSYYHGNRVGFTREVDEGVAAMEDKTPRAVSSTWNPEHKSEWYRRELRRAGVDIWYGSMGYGAVVEKDRVKGVIALTPQGRGVVLARVVVDATGNADIAAAADAPCRYTEETDVAVQGTGLPPRELGQKYTNTDYTFVDDTDIWDIWRVFVTARMKFKGAYDLGQLIDTRERRQIVGDMTLSPMDMVLGRTHPDTVVIARSNFDTHGYIVHPLFMLRPPHRDDIDVRVPYRCLLPRGLDGILVTGLGVSAHRDALPCIRMQADVQNQGYAAGMAAAMIARQDLPTRKLDIRALQKRLVEKGNLPERVLTETDSMPLPAAQVAKAVAAVTNDYEQLEVVVAAFDAAQPLLRQSLAHAAPGRPRLILAHILGMMGDAAGAQTLAQAVSSASWDKGWRYTGMGQFGASMSPLDSLIIALGRTRSPLALAPILARVRQLEATNEFSHFRAVAMALEALADPAAAPALAELLRKAGVGGHAVVDIGGALQANPASGTDVSTRNRALTELYLARALYRCGDHEGLGEKTLRDYARDLHGHYARHAQAILKRGPGSPRS